MTKSERTRQFIIERTAPLFNKKGFDGTTLAELTKATGLTKGALYGNFSDKEDLASAAFQYSIRKVKKLVKSKTEEKITYKGRLIALLEFYSQYVFDPPVPGGCPLLNTAIEADDHRTGMRKRVVKELADTVNFIQSLLDKGINNNEFKGGVNSRELAYTFFCSVEGALMFARAERSREPMEIIVKHCKKVLDQISK